MSLTLAAAPTGKRVGFTAAGGSSTQVVTTVAPKFWRPDPRGVVILAVDPNLRHYDLTLYEKDRLHVSAGDWVLHELLERCVEVSRRTSDEDPFGSSLLVPDVRPTAADLRQARQLRPETSTTATADLIMLFDRLDLLQPQADDLRALSRRSPLHRPLLYRRFLDEVRARVHSARHGYSSMTKLRTSVRGKVSPASALRHLRTRDPRLECQYDELTESTELLGIVCAGLEWIADGQGVRSPFGGRFEERQLRNDAVLLRRTLGEVTALSPVKALLVGPRLHLNRLDQVWAEALELSLAIVGEKEPVARGATISDAVELSIGTDLLWEKIVTEVLRSTGFGPVLPQTALPHGLAVDPWLANPRRKTELRPDNVAWRDGDLWIVDAKYKIRRGIPSREDQYQLFAYSHLVRDIDRDVRMAMLLYPGDDPVTTWTRGRDTSPAPVQLIAASIPFPEPHEVRTKEAWEMYLDGAARRLDADLGRISPSHTGEIDRRRR